MLQMVDGHDVSSIDPNYLRRHMGLVTQEPVLFDCSLRDNIAYGSPEPLEMDDIMKAARTANIHNFIASLPQVLGNSAFIQDRELCYQLSD
jgi:ABC-type multidrug transport system fused ATPase/permease subunit